MYYYYNMQISKESNVSKMKHVLGVYTRLLSLWEFMWYSTRISKHKAIIRVKQSGIFFVSQVTKHVSTCLKLSAPDF